MTRLSPFRLSAWCGVEGKARAACFSLRTPSPNMVNFQLINVVGAPQHQDGRDAENFVPSRIWFLKRSGDGVNTTSIFLGGHCQLRPSGWVHTAKHFSRLLEIFNPRPVFWIEQCTVKHKLRNLDRSRGVKNWYWEYSAVRAISRHVPGLTY